MADNKLEIFERNTTVPTRSSPSDMISLDSSHFSYFISSMNFYPSIVTNDWFVKGNPSVKNHSSSNQQAISMHVTFTFAGWYFHYANTAVHSQIRTSISRRCECKFMLPLPLYHGFWIRLKLQKQVCRCEPVASTSHSVALHFFFAGVNSDMLPLC